MGNLVAHAKHELSLIGGQDDEMQQMMNSHILKMVELFEDEGHSCSSAPYAVGVLEKLLMFEPLKPLTGGDEEWMEIGEGMHQNKRCSHVFKGADGRAYDLGGRIFREPSGTCFTSRDSRVYVEFPYTPKREYVDVPAPAPDQDRARP